MSKPKRTPPPQKPPVTVPGGPRAMRNARATEDATAEFQELHRELTALSLEGQKRLLAIVKKLLRATRRP